MAQKPRYNVDVQLAFPTFSRSPVHDRRCPEPRRDTTDALCNTNIIHNLHAAAGRCGQNTAIHIKTTGSSVATGKPSTGMPSLERWPWPLNPRPSEFPKCLFWPYLVFFPSPLTFWPQNLISSLLSPVYQCCKLWALIMSAALKLQQMD